MAAELLETAEPKFPNSEALKTRQAVRLSEVDGKESKHGSVQIHHLFDKGR
jgi:hypothetical protein